MNESSKEQRRFLKKWHARERRIKLLRLLVFVSILFVWQGAVWLGWLNDFIFSSPLRIAETFVTMLRNGSLFLHVGITLGETLLSFVLVTVVSIVVALLLWHGTTAAKILEPRLVLLNSLPKSALAPVLIVWLGNNIKTIIIAGISVAVFGSILTLYHAFQETDPDHILLIYTLKGNRFDVLKKVILPGNLPVIVSNMKVNIGLCLVGVIIGEFLSADVGLGYLIIYGSQVFKMDWVMMSIVLLCLIAMGLYQALALLEKKQWERWNNERNFR